MILWEVVKQAKKAENNTGVQFKELVSELKVMKRCTTVIYCEQKEKLDLLLSSSFSSGYDQ